jgi:hypothetical protein
MLARLDEQLDRIQQQQEQIISLLMLHVFGETPAEAAERILEEEGGGENPCK